VKNVVHGQPMDLSNLEDINMVLLCSKPGQTTIRYIRMKAYGNHFEVEDSRNYSLQTFDSGVAYVFDMPTTNVFEISVNYVGILKNIFKLDYSLMHNLVIIFRCEWIKRENNRGNLPMYEMMVDSSQLIFVTSWH
jgi:hypothetical protein